MRADRLAGFALDPCERLPGRLLFGGLLRLPLTAAVLLPADERGTREAPVVRRPLDRDLCVRHLAAAAREQLLQVCLVVDAGREGMLDLSGESSDDRILDRREAVLEEERAQRGLDDRREHVPVPRQPLELLVVGLRVSRTRDETLPEAELACDLGAGRTRDDVGSHLREPALVEVRVTRVERVRDRELEDAVAEELEPLVGRGTIARPRGVREDWLRQLRRERVDQLREFPGVRGYWCEAT